MDNVTERRWLPLRRGGGGGKDHQKEHRLSKESIGQPMKLEKNGRFSNIFEPNDNLSSGHPPSMTMKCIIVHPDDLGYGLTVSGDKPVYIQSVKEGGAAAKAGVVEGDRILKVNGDAVKNMNHTEVVKLIKEKAYVALTLLGDSMKASESFDVVGTSRQQQPGDSGNQQTGGKHSHAFFDEKLETIKKMLEQEKAEVERIKEEYAENTDPKLLKRLGAAEKMKQDLEKQLWKAESKKDRHEQELSSLAMTSSPSDTDVTGSSDTLVRETTDESSMDASSSDRPDINGRTDRKYGPFNSVYKSIPNVLRKQSSIDEDNRTSLHMRNDASLPPKSKNNSESGSPQVQNHSDALSKSLTEFDQKETSPPSKHRFTRNPSMTSRAKKLNRRSMPSFKINEEGGLEQIDLPQSIIERTYENSHGKGHKTLSSFSSNPSPNSLQNGPSSKTPKTPPPVPPRTSSKNIWNRTTTHKQEKTLSVASVRRVVSFSEAEAPESKQDAPRAFKFPPPLSPKATRSLDNLAHPSPGSSPLESAPSSPVYKSTGTGLSRKRSHVLRRKRGTPTAGRLKRIPVQLETSEGHDSDMVVTNDDRSTMDLVNSAMPPNPFAEMPGHSDANKSSTQQSQNREIMSFEEDSDIMAKCTSEPGPFDDFDALRQRPAYLAVFLNFIVESKDPANFLLFMAVDSYKQLSSSKDMVKYGDVIYKTYLAPDAAFKIFLDDGMARSIQSVLTTKNPAEETLRGVFDPAVQVALKEIRNQLTTFRVKREQGVGNMYGGEKLRKALNMDMQSDTKLVEEIMAPTLNKLQHMTSADDIDQARINIKLDAIQGFLSQFGTKRSKKTSKIYSKFRSKPPRMSGSVDSIIDDTKDKRLSGIGNIFGGKRAEKTKSKSEKPKPHDRGGSKRDKASRRHTIRDNPPVFPISFLKSTRVSTSVSADQLTLMVPSAGDPSDQGRRTDGAFLEPFSGRPKSVPFDASVRTIETHSVTVHPAPQLHEAPVFNFGSHLGFGNQGEENDDPSDDDLLSVNKNNLARAGSFRRPGEPRSGAHKSHSDPDKNKVEQAVVHHNASNMEQSESYSPDSSHSILPDYSMPSFNQDEEIDIDVTEQQWSDCVPRSVARGLEKKEVKRQQIINELISTEQHHVRNLKILEKLFYEPLLSHGFLNRDELNQAFPNLKDILQLHREFNRDLQEIKETDGHVVKHIGDLLLSRFDGEGGNTFKNECANYCGNQFTVLSLIKEKSKKDPKFNQFLEEAQRHPFSRKLHLKDFIPMEIQRLTKYPLLLDNIIKHTKKKQEAEIKKVRTAYDRCREILTFADQTVKEAEDRQQIIEIQQNLDRDSILKLKHDDKVSATLHEFKNMDLTERTIIHQGPLTWRIGQADKKKQIGVHCILYDDVLVLLQKQDDRYVLCCHGGQSTGGLQEPFISMQRAHVSTVAYDKRAFFVVSYVPAQMCEFVASSSASVRKWMSIIGKTVKTEMTPMISSRRKALSIPVQIRDEDEILEEDKAEVYLSAGNLIGRAEANNPELIPIQFDPSAIPPTIPGYSDTSVLQSRIHLVQQKIANALVAKHRLLAQISNLEDADLEEMLDMCAADDNPDPVTLIRHAVLCADRLTGIINSSANIDNAFVKQGSQVTDVSKRLSVNSRLTSTSDQNDDFQVGSPDKWASRVPHPSHSLPPEKSPTFIRGSSGTLNSVSSLPYSESAPILSPHSDISDSKPSQDFLPDDSGRQGYPQFDPPISPTLQLPPTSPMHRVPESMSLPLEAHQSRPTSYPASSDHSSSRPSSMVDLWVPGGAVPIDKMMATVLTLQTQLTRLMHVTEESEREKIELAAENDRLKKALEKSTQDGSSDMDSPPAYTETVQ